MQCKI